MFLHFRVSGYIFRFIWVLYLQVSLNCISVFVWTMALGHDAFVCSGYEGGFSLHCCGSSSCVVITVFFKNLLSSVFRSNSIKAVQKQLVCILQPHEPLWVCILQPHEPLTRGAKTAVLARYWCLPWTSSSTIAVYITFRNLAFPIWAQCTRWYPWTSAVTPQRRGLNAPVANWRVYTDKN